jgi:hypothetical protein
VLGGSLLGVSMWTEEIERESTEDCACAGEEKEDDGE